MEDRMNQTPKARKKGNIIFIIIIAITLAGFVFSLINSQRLRSDGIRTTATVTNVESRHIDNISSDGPRIRFYITFEYQVDSQPIIVVRTREFNNSNARPPFRVGEQIEIYVAARNPRNFVFAYNDSFGIAGFIGVGVFVVASIVISIPILKERKR